MAQGPSIAGADWFNWAETRAVFACLNREGFEARAVGGAVRNSLLGLPVTEVDFATTARPDDILRLAGEAGIKAVPTGYEHGTITLVEGGRPFEATTLRRDVETFGRHAVVAFGNDWAEDAARRDFTINALFADSEGRVHDPLGGLPDLEARRVRFIGDPDERIREDYLRILRFFRFSADLAHGEFDSAGVAASIRERDGLSLLSRERVRAEFLRILMAKRAPEALRILDESGLLLRILGGVALRGRFERLRELEIALGLPPEPVFHLAALGAMIDEDAKRLAERLRLSTAEGNDLAALAALKPSVGPGLSRSEAEAVLYRIGPRRYLGRLLLAWAEAGAAPDDGAWREAASFPQIWRKPKFPLNGSDLMALGWEQGPALGEALKKLENYWIAEGFRPSREQLLALASSNHGGA